ncbi:diacylglycerol/lipid kinase family protein [Leifsonia sp. NPDC058292]|uniref:diacylglycerol/lipid kinase family protein n=1 Tax=Leifsonia sp. NPDC058292 TaxID=3346428 RepID=UPI0036DD9151
MSDRPSIPSGPVAVVYNPIKVDIARVKAAIEAAAARAGVASLMWFETTVENEGQQQTRDAVAAGATLVIAAGGDGTVRAVAEAVRDTDAVLAILPSGTGNLLARNIGITHSSVEVACAIAFEGATRAIDIGLAVTTGVHGEKKEHTFLVMVGLGIDAAMIANTRPRLKRRVGWLAYVDAGFRALPRAQKVRVGYALDDGEPRSAHVSTILVANCGTLPGNIVLIPDALVDDGMLDIAIMQPKSMFGWLMIWRKVTWENRVLRKTALGQRIIRITDRAVRTELSYLRSGSVQLTVEVPEPFELDGDGFGEVVAVDLTVHRRGLKVRVPSAV